MGDTPAVHSLIVNLPPEIFADFCSFLSPADLFTLSQVCRKFRGYLCAPNSFSTQQIWEGSRLQFIPGEKFPPPEGMSEEKYVELLLTVRGCQVCKRSKECEIYWEFGVRCCKECFSKNTIEHDKLTEINCPREFINIMPYITVDYNRYYWIEQIDLVYSQYFDSLLRKNLKTWLKGKRKMFNSIIKYAKKRKREPSSREPSYWSYVPSWSYGEPTYRRYRLRSFNLFQLLVLPPPPPPYPIIFLPFPPPPSLPNSPPTPPLSKFLNTFWLIQSHIQRLEDQSQVNIGANLKDFTKIKKEKKRKFYNKDNKPNTKGKDFKNKSAHKLNKTIKRY